MSSKGLYNWSLAEHYDNAILERDSAILEMDSAILEMDSAILVKDNAILENDDAILTFCSYYLNCPVRCSILAKSRTPECPISIIKLLV